MDDGSQDGEELRLVGLHHDGDHLPIEVRRRVVRLDNRPEFLDALLGVEELPAIGEVRAKRLVRQPEFLQKNARAIGAEAAAVKADVEKPVALEFRLLRRRVEEKLRLWLFPLDADLDLQGAELVEPQGGHAVKIEFRERALEFPVRVVPEHDALAFGVEGPAKCGLNLPDVAHSSSSAPTIARDLASRSPNLA